MDRKSAIKAMEKTMGKKASRVIGYQRISAIDLSVLAAEFKYEADDGEWFDVRVAIFEGDVCRTAFYLEPKEGEENV